MASLLSTPPLAATTTARRVEHEHEEEAAAPAMQPQQTNNEQIKRAIYEVADLDAEDYSDSGSGQEDDDDDNFYADDPTRTRTPNSTGIVNDHASACTRTVVGCRLEKCTVCGDLPLRKPQSSISQGNLWDDAAAWDWDGGLYDIIRQMGGQQETEAMVLPPNLADDTVQDCVRHLKRLKQDLIREGLQRDEHQNYSGESLSSARIVAPLDPKEIEVGPVLGTGAFSTVYEVAAFHPRRRYIEGKGLKFSRNEELSRQYLADHAQIHPDETLAADVGKYGASESKLGGGSPDVQKAPTKRTLSLPYARYAVKHLRNALVTRSAEKFKRAAIDLVLEGQLLLVLDHPHIVSLRGWSAKGPEAFRSGNPRDFFLVLDKLPLTLDDQVWQWRTQLTKYRRRLRRRNARQRSCLQTWMRRRLRRGRNEEKQKEQPHAPDKYAVKIQDQFFERLRTALHIASAIMYMHSKRLIHRDLKTSNIGMDARNEVKLFDLGLSRLLPVGKDEISIGGISSIGGTSRDFSPPGSLHDGYVMSRVGTKFYMAPEVRRKNPYSLSADVYSFGIVLWELLSLSTPRDVYHQRKEEFAKKSAKKQWRDSTADEEYALFKQQVKNESANGWLPICPCWSEELQDLIKSTLAFDPADRPTMEQVHAILNRHANGEPVSPASDARRRRSTFRLDLSHPCADEVKEEETATDSVADRVINGKASSV